MWATIGAALGWILGWIVTGIFAAIGWYLASFYLKPLLDFYNLKSQVDEEIIFRGNVGEITAHDRESHDKAIDALRRLGAKVQAMNKNTARLLRFFIRKNKYDLETAGKALIGLSNSLDNDDRRDLEINRIQRALKIPPDLPVDVIRAIKEQLSKHHIS